jgi:hypothetical protein
MKKLFLISILIVITMTMYGQKAARHTSKRFAKVKEPFFPSHEKSKFTNTNFKIK